MLTADRARSITRLSLVSAAVAGTAFFGALYAAASTSPRQIERAAQAFLRAEVESSVRTRFGDRADSSLAALDRTGVLGAALAARADSLRRIAASDWPDRIAPILDLLCCAERDGADRAAATRAALEARARDAEGRLETLRAFVVGAYQARVQALVEELRRFAAVNATLFGIVGLLLFIRRRDMRPVLLPCAVLVLSTLGAITFYVTTQDWFWAILLGDYMGGWYLVLIGTTVAFAADVAFLDGRVSSGILGSLPAALVPPC